MSFEGALVDSRSLSPTTAPATALAGCAALAGGLRLDRLALALQ